MLLLFLSLCPCPHPPCPPKGERGERKRGKSNLLTRKAQRWLLLVFLKKALSLSLFLKGKAFKKRLCLFLLFPFPLRGKRGTKKQKHGVFLLYLLCFPPLFPLKKASLFFKSVPQRGKGGWGGQSKSRGTGTFLKKSVAFFKRTGPLKKSKEGWGQGERFFYFFLSPFSPEGGKSKGVALQGGTGKSKRGTRKSKSKTSFFYKRKKNYV